MTKADKYKTLAMFPIVLLIAIFEPIWDELVRFWKGSTMCSKYKENFTNIWNIYTKEVWK